MRWFISVVLVAVLLMLSCTALAQAKPIEAIPPGDDVIVPLAQGKGAPFDGQLFDNASALRWANWLRQYKERLKTDVDEQQQICTVRTDALTAQLSVQEQKYLTATSGYQQQVADLMAAQSHPPWYKTPTFYYGAGVLSTVAVTVAAAVLVSAAH